MVFRRHCRWHLWTPMELSSLPAAPHRSGPGSLRSAHCTLPHVLQPRAGVYCQGRVIVVLQAPEHRAILDLLAAVHRADLPFFALFSFSYLLWCPSPWFSPVTLKSSSSRSLSRFPLCIPEWSMVPERASWFSSLVPLHMLLDEAHSHPGLQLPLHANNSLGCVSASLHAMVPWAPPAWQVRNRAHALRSTPAACLTLVPPCRNLSHAGLVLCSSAPSYHYLQALGAWLLVSPGSIHFFYSYLLHWWLQYIPLQMAKIFLRISPSLTRSSREIRYNQRHNLKWSLVKVKIFELYVWS